MYITKGDDKTWVLNFKDNGGDAIDITDWTIWLTVKKSYADSDANAVIQVKQTNHTDASNGVSSIAIDRDDSTDFSEGEYYCDIQVKNDSDEVLTIYSSKFIVKPEVTIATS